MLLTVLKILPKNLMSRLVGRLMAMQSPKPLVRLMKVWFAGHYQIRLDEAEKDFDEYTSINALFTRKLKSGIRPLQGDLIHPCDSKIAVSGEIVEGELLQAKGWSYSLADLIGNDDLASNLSGGHFTTYYLCPTDYHRVHSPVEGNLMSVRHIPGALWPVNPASVNGIRGLFVKNERVVFEIETVFGVMALVMVGATNVGKITTSVGPSWQTNSRQARLVAEQKIEPSEHIKAGQELGIFHMGSTVICCWPKQAGLDLTAEIGKDVLLGQSARGSAAGG